MMNKLARIISTLFVPPSFTIILFSILAFTIESELTKQVITIIIAILFGFIAQIILFFSFKKRNKIADLDASIKEERTAPFLISVGFYLIGLAVLIFFKMNIVSIAFWFCYISNTLIAIFINLKWKISAHTMGASGPLAAAAYVFGPIVLWFFILVILIGYSRIQLKVHSLSQVTAGVLFGFLSTYLQMNLFVSLFE